MANDRRVMSLSPHGHHPFTFAPGLIPTTVINKGKSGVGSLHWTQPSEFLARCFSFQGWKPSAGEVRGKQLITATAG